MNKIKTLSIQVGDLICLEEPKRSGYYNYRVGTIMGNTGCVCVLTPRGSLVPCSKIRSSFSSKILGMAVIGPSPPATT